MDGSENRGSVAPGGATFLVRVLFRQNASWQGSIQWLDGKASRPFRSLLEMILLINEALETTGGPDTVSEFRTWNEKEEVS